MTLLSRDHFETAYAVLCHFHLIAQRAPIIFSQVWLNSSTSVQLQSACTAICSIAEAFAQLQKLLFRVFVAHIESGAAREHPLH